MHGEETTECKKIIAKKKNENTHLIIITTKPALCLRDGLD
jgi:hypothetical protein